MDTNILIVDDDDVIRYTMRDFIIAAGYNSKSAASAEEALDVLATDSVQIVITDIRLPGQDGLELTETIKRDYDIDVIVMTGYSGDYAYEKVIGKGASDLVFKPVRYEELLLRLKRVLKERQLTKERNRMLEQLKELAITDGLTQLYNSRHFYNQLEIETDRSNRYGHSIALLLLDIDHFKQYNDTYGHVEGDKVLLRIGQIIKACLRATDTAYRYGGEEFTVILPETTGIEAVTAAQRIRTAVEAEKFFPEHGDAHTITISIGVTEYIKSEKLKDFVQRADRGMYFSKKQGRNRVSSLFGDSD
ncbi:diguanylate cyclase [Thermodesulfobacteriota bacterium]